MLKKSGDYMVGLLVCHNHKKLNRSGYCTIGSVITMKFWLEPSVSGGRES